MATLAPVTRAFRIGLTGGIASGKSTVATRFEELGVAVVDADVAARTVVEPGRPALARITQMFGPDILTDAGRLDRRRLREHVFNDPERRRALEALLHPLIRAEMEAAVEAASALATHPYIVMAIPLLVESGDLNRVDRILVIDLPEHAQLARVMARDGMTRAAAEAILAAQATRAERLAAADDVLENTGSIETLRHAVDVLHARYLEYAAARAGHRL